MFFLANVIAEAHVIWGFLVIAALAVFSGVLLILANQMFQRRRQAHFHNISWIRYKSIKRIWSISRPKQPTYPELKPFHHTSYLVILTIVKFHPQPTVLIGSMLHINRVGPVVHTCDCDAVPQLVELSLINV